jgi:hypothetical protein
MNKRDYCVFILTYGRPDNIKTDVSLMKSGYTGEIFYIVSDDDKSIEKYKEKYGDKVIIFSKEEIAKTFDEADDGKKKNAVIYARNACFEIAKKIGYKYFIELDDDYLEFWYRHNNKNEYGNWKIKNLDNVFEYVFEFLKNTPTKSIALAQGGDYMGGFLGRFGRKILLHRKCMNSFFCCTDKPFLFLGRINEDVNTYTRLANTGDLFFTISTLQLNQSQTQSNEGGMTDFYLASVTYVKSFYTVMFMPSAVKVKDMGRNSRRMHHSIKWDNAVPKIISQKHKKDIK